MSPRLTAALPFARGEHLPAACLVGHTVFRHPASYPTKAGRSKAAESSGLVPTRAPSRVSRSGLPNTEAVRAEVVGMIWNSGSSVQPESLQELPLSATPARTGL